MTDRRHTRPASPGRSVLPPTRSDLAAVATLVLAVLARWWRVLPGVGDWHFEAGDFVDQFYAFAHFEVAELAAGRLPLWNPHAFAGSPFWADIQAAVAYPPSLAIALVAAWTRGSLPYRTLELEAVGHVLLAALGTYLFARRLFGRRGPALIAALAFGLGGWVNGYPPLQLAVLEAAAWLPFALWGVARTVDRPRDWPLPALALGMCVLAGHPQTTLYVGYTTAAWALWLLWRGWRKAEAEAKVEAEAEVDRTELAGSAVAPEAMAESESPSAQARSSWSIAATSSMSFLRHARPRLVALAAAAVGALGLSAAGWLPAAAYLRLSNRAEAGYDMLAHGFPAGELLGVVLPDITKWAPLYVGLLPLILALLAMGWTLFGAPKPLTARADKLGEPDPSLAVKAEEPLPQPPADNPFWIGLAIIALLLSLGRNGILFDLFYHLAPGFDLFRGQERAAMLVSFALAMLAGAGASILNPWILRAGASWGADRGSQGRPPISWARLSMLASTLLIVLDLVRVGGSTNLTRTPPPELTRAPAQMILSQAGLDGRVHDHPDRWERRWPLNAGMLHGYASLDGASPLRPRTYDALREAVADDERRLWELLAVSYVLSGREEIAGAAKLMALDDGSSLFALDAPWPRAWRVPEAETVDDATAAARLADVAWDPMSVVLLAEEGAATAREDAGEGESKDEGSLGSGEESSGAPVDTSAGSGAGTLTAVEIPAPGEVLVRTEGPAPAWILFSEIHDPAWRASIDGRDTLVQRADLGLMAVAVPAGSQELRLRYRPRSVPIGLGLSLVSALVLVMVLATGRWGRRNRPVGPQRA